MQGLLSGIAEILDGEGTIEWYERGATEGATITIDRLKMARLKDNYISRLLGEDAVSIYDKACYLAIIAALEVDTLGKNHGVYLLSTIAYYTDLTKEEFEEWQDEYFEGEDN